VKLQDCHSAYIPSRDEIGTFAVDAVTKNAGPFVTRTDEILLAASGWVLRASAGKVAQDLPPVWKFFKRLLRIKTTNAVAKRTVAFHDGVTIEFTVRVIDGGKK
jgi:hypothetical protein